MTYGPFNFIHILLLSSPYLYTTLPTTAFLIIHSRAAAQSSAQAAHTDGRACRSTSTRARPNMTLVVRKCSSLYGFVARAWSQRATLAAAATRCMWPSHHQSLHLSPQHMPLWHMRDQLSPTIDTSMHCQLSHPPTPAANTPNTSLSNTPNASLSASPRPLT